MGTEVATSHRERVLARIAELKKAGAVPSPRNTGVQYFDLSGNDGTFTVGRNKIEVPADQKFVAPLEGARRSWLYWEAKKVTNRIVAKVLEGMPAEPPEDDLRVGDSRDRPRDGWSLHYGLQMTGLGGEFDGIVVDLEKSSKGVENFFNDVVGAAIDMAENPESGGMFNPILTIEIKSYENKKHDRTVYFPEPTIVDWTDAGGRLLSEENPTFHAVVCGGASDECSGSGGLEDIVRDPEPLTVAPPPPALPPF